MITIEIKKIGEVGFTNRTSSVQWESLVVRQALTKEADSCSFSVLKYGSLTYRPDPEDEIIVKEDGVKIFAGFVVRVQENLLDGPIMEYVADCRDYSHLLDRKLVNKSYEDSTVQEIIDDIVANFSASGITTTNVDGTDVIDFIAFNNIDPTKALQKLADIFNYDWYIDYDKDIHFFSKEANAAPFALTDTGRKHLPNSLTIVRDSTQIKNSILVEGGNQLSDTEFTDKWVGNGQQRQFKTTYSMKDFTLTVNGVVKTVGVEGLHNFPDYDALYNASSLNLIFPEGSPPADTHLIEFTGLYYFKLRMLIREASSIATYGEKQFIIKDNSIKDRATARERAKAELFAFANTLSEGSFMSYESGLRAGQQIEVNSTTRDISELFMINGLEMKLISPQKAIWTANLVTMKTFDVIDLLNAILKKESVSEDENVSIGVADLILRNIGVGRDIFQNELDIIWVTGPYYPSDFATDPQRACWTNVGCVTNSSMI